MTKQRQSIEPMRRINGNIRAQQAPDKINSFKQALHAAQQGIKYREMSFRAYHSYMIAGGGTHTSRMHHERYEKYSDIADQWECVLCDWLANNS